MDIRDFVSILASLTSIHWVVVVSFLLAVAAPCHHAEMPRQEEGLVEMWNKQQTVDGPQAA